MTAKHTATPLPSDRSDVEKRVEQGLDWMVAWCGKWDHERIRALTVKKSGKLERREQMKEEEKKRRSKWQIVYDRNWSGMSQSVRESVWKWNRARKQHGPLWNRRIDGGSFPRQEGIITVCLPLTRNPADCFIHMDCLLDMNSFHLNLNGCPWLCVGDWEDMQALASIIWSCAWRLCHCTNGISKNGLRSVWLESTETLS